MVTDGTPTASRRDPDGSQDIGRYVSRDRASRDMLTPSDFLNEPLDRVHHVRCPEATAIFRWQRQHGCGRSPSPHQHRERRIGSAIQFGSATQCSLGKVAKVARAFAGEEASRMLSRTPLLRL